MDKKDIDELIEKGYDLNKVDYFHKHISNLYLCGIDTRWIKELNKFQVDYIHLPTRLYVEPEDFSCEKVVLAVVRYNMAACLPS